VAVRVGVGGGSWLLLGLAAGVGLETKYTLAVVLVLLVAFFAVWRRDALASRGFPLAVAIAALLLLPNLIWEAGHGLASVHWFLNPPPSATDESRPQYIAHLLLLAGPAAVPLAAAGVLALLRDRRLRPLRATVIGTVLAYLLLNGKSYYAGPVLLFALAAGSVPFDRWATRRRLQIIGAAFVVLLMLLLPLGLPVLSLHAAIQHGIVKTRSDYQ